MISERILSAILFSCICAASLDAQDAAPTPVPDPVLTRRPLSANAGTASDTGATVTQTIPLTVVKGTPVQVALDDEVRVRSAGQSIKGHVIEPVYAFDKLVIPVGTIATGQITAIEDVSTRKRTMAALDADFTPAHKVEIEFSDLALADGKHIAVRTSVTPGSGQELNFVTAKEDEHKKGVKDTASQKAKEARAQAQQD